MPGMLSNKGGLLRMIGLAGHSMQNPFGGHSRPSELPCRALPGESLFLLARGLPLHHLMQCWQWLGKGKGEFFSVDVGGWVELWRLVGWWVWIWAKYWISQHYHLVQKIQWLQYF